MLDRARKRSALVNNFGKAKLRSDALRVQDERKREVESFDFRR
jgi:hypothetical protein